MFACRNCEYQEEAENVCVYRHEIAHAPSYVYIDHPLIS
jgi:DNA-directed RNA polymerase II subunit RPB9